MPLFYDIKCIFTFHNKFQEFLSKKRVEEEEARRWIYEEESLEEK